jgi:hypothetical protein
LKYHREIAPTLGWFTGHIRWKARTQVITTARFEIVACDLVCHEEPPYSE